MDRCEACGTTGAFQRFTFREMLFGTRETFDYRHCPGCGLLQIVVIPADLGRHYPDEYYAGYQGAAGSSQVAEALPSTLIQHAIRARNRWILFRKTRLTDRILRRWSPHLNVPKDDRIRIRKLGVRSFDDAILDVGCGRFPRYLLELRDLGFTNLHGVDPFLDSDVTVGDIPLRRLSIHDVTGTFRTVMLHHSFEHVPDPGATMAAAAARLEPDGVLLIRTPVGATWFWRTFGRDWWELDAPRHLFVHTQASLEHLAAAAGLELVEIVWDTSYVELIASIQITRDIAWREAASWNLNPPGPFDDAQIQQFRRQAIELNEAADGGRAGFYFRRRVRPMVLPAGRHG
jgi:SAM-dependent methyltransferase